MATFKSNSSCTKTPISPTKFDVEMCPSLIYPFMINYGLDFDFTNLYLTPSKKIMTKVGLKNSVLDLT